MKKPVILCVDDEQTILSSLKSELNRALEYTCFIEVADSGEDGLDFCRELLAQGEELVVVISDYLMPGMKGDELLRQISLLSPHTRNIMLTGQANLAGVTRAVNQANLYRYVPKPWQSEDLKLTVKEALRSYYQSRQLEELTREQAALIEQLRENEKALTQFAHEQEKLKQAYARFVPRQFLNLLGKSSIADIQLGDQVEQDMSVMFSDIRGFTSLSEHLTPQENFGFINAYLRRMEPVIRAHNGFIDKYIGDAIMALFPVRADDAVRAAVGMLRTLAGYNAERLEKGYADFAVGIGINTGHLMLGTVGGDERMDSTVIADAVNLAARIEQLTKSYGSGLLITEHTYARLQNPQDYLTRVVDHVTVKGKTAPVTVYEVFDADPPDERALKLATREMFVQGFTHFHAGQFDAARECFVRVLQTFPDERVARVYLKNCEKILNTRLPAVSTILAVDDVPANLALLERLLGKHGFRVLSAEDGERALRIAGAQLPDLILLDVMMPEMDGFEVCKQLKALEKTRQIPVIFMSAMHELPNKVRAFELGAVDYITKPFQMQEVLARIKTHLSNAHLQRQLQLRNVELEIHNLELKDKVNRQARNEAF